MARRAPLRAEQLTAVGGSLLLHRPTLRRTKACEIGVQIEQFFGFGSESYRRLFCSGLGTRIDFREWIALDLRGREHLHIVVRDIIPRGATELMQERATTRRRELRRVEECRGHEVAEVVQARDLAAAAKRRREILTEQRRDIHRIAVPVERIVEHTHRVELRIREVGIDVGLGGRIGHTDRRSAERVSAIRLQR